MWSVRPDSVVLPVQTVAPSRPAWALVLLSPLFLFAFFAPLLDSLHWLPAIENVSLFDWQRLFECAVLSLTLLLAGLGLAGRRHDIVLTWQFFAGMSAVFLLGAAAIFFRSDLHREAWREWLLFFELGLVGLILKELTQGLGERFADAAISALLGAALCYLMLIIVINHMINWMEIPFEQFTFIGFNNVRMFSDWQAIFLPLFPLAYSQYCTTCLSRWATGLTGSLFYALIFISAARSPLLGLLVAHAVYFAIFRSRYMPMLIRGCGFIVGGLAIHWLCRLYVLPGAIGWGSAAAGAGRTFSLTALAYTLDRQTLWSDAIDMANRAFPLGVGPGMFAAYPNAIAAAPHNAFLSIAAEWGWPVAVLIGYCVVSYFIGRLRRVTSALQVGQASSILADKQTDILLSIVFALLMLFVQSMVSTNVLLGPILPIFILISMTIVWAFTGAEKSVQGTNGRVLRCPWFLLVPVILVTAFTFMSLILSDFSRVGINNSAYFACGKPTLAYAPRFWLQGWLVSLCNDSAEQRQ